MKKLIIGLIIGFILGSVTIAIAGSTDISVESLYNRVFDSATNSLTITGV